MVSLFPPTPEVEEEDPSIVEQTEGLRQGNTQQLLAKSKKIENIKSIVGEPPKKAGSGLLAAQSMDDGSTPSGLRAAMGATSKSISGSDVVNFLFGDEMGILGFQMDNEGLHHEWEIAKDQWANEPLWVNLLAATSLVGSALFPAYSAVNSSLKFGKLGTKLGRIGDKASEVTRLKSMGLLNEADTVDTVTDTTLKGMRMQEHQRTSYNKLSVMMEAEIKGELKISGFEKAKFAFDKRFANLHFKLSQGVVAGQGAKQAFHKSLDELWKGEDIGKLFTDMPAADSKIVNYLYHKENPSLFPKVNLTPKETQYAEMMREKYVAHQSEVVANGLVSEETGRHVGSMHIPAQLKGTPMPDIDMTRSYLNPMRGRKVTTRPGVLVGKDVPRTSKVGKALLGDTKHVVKEEGKQTYMSLSTHDGFRLDFDTLSKQRTSDLPEVARRLQNGELITDPAEINLRGYMMDRMINNNFIATRDMAMNRGGEFSTPFADIATKFNVDSLLTKSQMNDAAAKAGFIPMDNVPDGARAALVRMIKKEGGSLGPKDELPYMRKAAFDEIFGEDGAFNQIQAASDMMEVITTMYKTSKTAFSLPTHFQNGGGNLAFLLQAGMNPFSPKNAEILIESKRAFDKIAKYHEAGKKAGMSSRDILDNARVDLGKMTRADGKTFDFNELLDPQIRELIEESAMQNAEGAGRLDQLLKSLNPEQRLTRGAINTYMKAKSFVQGGDRVKWADGMTKAYLAEDMIPKIGFYSKLRMDGWTKQAAIIETGRRLPMYGTVGSAIRQGRKYAFPWATFPTEAMRITKNNLTDYPLRMMPWLQATNIMQASFSAMGEGPTSKEELDALKSGLPMWAQTPQTVVGTGDAAATLGGGLTGGLAGGVAGAKVGGAGAALAGAAIGAVAGAAGARAITTEKEAEGMRGMIIDWVPHSAFMLASNSPDMMGDYAPWRNLRGAIEQSPIEPFSIFKPMLEIMSGKTGWGSDIPSAGTGDDFGKLLAGYIGFLAPPLIQKYGFKTNTPDVSASEAILGKSVPGDITNVSRLQQDAGVSIDPNTGRPGSLSHDLVLKNFGMGKSWGVHGAVALANELETEKQLGKVRNYLSRQLSSYAANGKEDRVMTVLTEVMETYSKQYADNPVKATQEYQKWVESKLATLGTLPKLRGWTTDEMKRRMGKSFAHGAEMRGRGRGEVQRTITQQLAIRGLGT